MVRVDVVGVVCAGLAACAIPNDDALDSEAMTAAEATPSDAKASLAARTVLANLRSFDFHGSNAFDHRVLIGQQDADISDRASYGVSVTPDIQRLANRTPGLVSYELSNADRGATSLFDAAAFRAGRTMMRDLVLAQHQRGALVSFVWHMRCPKASASDPDRYSPAECPPDYRLSSIRQGGIHFAEWRGILDELAALLASLDDGHGGQIPVLLRPFHEFAGNWFWWGNQNSPADYVGAWQEMVGYLRDTKGLHNLLWVLSVNAPSDVPNWQSFYPGDGYVDVVAFDRYDERDGGFGRGYGNDLSVISQFASTHQKAAAVSEVGIDLESPEEVDPNWFTSTMLAPLRAYGFAYAGLWRNAPWEKFIPEPNDGPIADDFVRLANDPGALFAGTHDLYLPLHAK
jgi:mannan endo-1,4-beta-mannosidase